MVFKMAVLTSKSGIDPYSIGSKKMGVTGNMLKPHWKKLKKELGTYGLHYVCTFT